MWPRWCNARLLFNLANDQIWQLQRAFLSGTFSPKRLKRFLSAVLDLVGFLFYDFAATAMWDQRSCFNKRMGKQLMGKNISLHDDAYHPLQTGAPFDGEGIPRQRILLVDKGVPTNLVFARATARKMKIGAQK
jgi:hypothetical protein